MGNVDIRGDFVSAATTSNLPEIPTSADRETAILFLSNSGFTHTELENEEMFASRQSIQSLNNNNTTNNTTTTNNNDNDCL